MRDTPSSWISLLCTQTHPAVAAWAPRPPGQTSHMKMPECYIRVCWTERSTRSRREARWHPGQRGSGRGGCLPRPASQNIPDSAPQKGENTLNQRKPLWASLFTSRFVINTYRCLYVNRIIGKPHGNIPLGTRNSGADTGECCIWTPLYWKQILLILWRSKVSQQRNTPVLA